MTFQNQEDEISSGEDLLRGLLGQVTGREELEECDLGPLSTLEPELESFLVTPTPMWGVRDRCGLPSEPSKDNYDVWLEWWAHQVDMPDWWGELITILNAGDPRV